MTTLDLTIDNFRVFSHASFSFRSDYTLISGPSGSGKTSILMAIQFAITGEGKKVIKYGKSNCKVTLSLGYILITRTKGPCRLIVEFDSKIYEDAEAQSIINDRIQNWEFGYVSQRMYKSFLLMTPADKLTLIEKMTFTGFDIEKLQTKCKSLISDRKNALADATTKRVTIEKILTDLGHSESSCAALNFNGDKNYLLNERKNIVNKQEQTKKELEEAILTRDRKNRILAELTELETNLIEYGKNDVMFIESPITLDELIRRTESYNKYYTVKTDLDETIPLSGMNELEIDACINDMLNLQRLNTNLLNLEKYKSELVERNRYKKTHAVGIGNCPSCNIPLYSWNGELVIDTVCSISETEAEACEKLRLKLITDIATLESMEIERDNILSLYDGDLCVNEQLDYMKRVKRNDKIWIKCNELMCDKPDQDVNHLIKRLKEREVLNTSIKLARAKIDKLNESLLSLKNVRDPSDISLELMMMDEDLKFISDSISLYDAKTQWEKVCDMRRIEMDMESKIPKAVRLASLIKTAERLALEDAIFNINLRAGIYLSGFLPSVVASLIFDTKRLSEKIDVKIELNGESTDVNSLSGGEFARLVLAFAIAMAEMNDIRTLMLDESFAALDAETTECVLNTIKENYIGKVIIIAHQTTKGIFDTVIELNRM